MRSPARPKGLPLKPEDVPRETMQHVLDVSLGLFRKQGFDRTTMRQIAAGAGLSLGAAYYWFPTKDAIVLAYYERQLEEHEAEARAAFARTDDARERVLLAFTSKLAGLKKDRGLLGALFRSVADPEAPTSLFSDVTSPTRTRSIALFAEALAPLALPAPVAAAAAVALWAVMMGLILYFLHDDSRQQARSFALAEEVTDLVIPLLPLAATPAGEQVVMRVLGILEHAGLLPTGERIREGRPPVDTSRRASRRPSPTSSPRRRNR
jgi:AcrR family transcriptional regulator